MNIDKLFSNYWLNNLNTDKEALKDVAERMAERAGEKGRRDTTSGSISFTNSTEIDKNTFVNSIAQALGDNSTQALSDYEMLFDILNTNSDNVLSGDELEEIGMKGSVNARSLWFNFFGNNEEISSAIDSAMPSVDDYDWDSTITPDTDTDSDTTISTPTYDSPFEEVTSLASNKNFKTINNTKDDVLKQEDTIRNSYETLKEVNTAIYDQKQIAQNAATTANTEFSKTALSAKSSAELTDDYVKANGYLTTAQDALTEADNQLNIAQNAFDEAKAAFEDATKAYDSANTTYQNIYNAYIAAQEAAANSDDPEVLAKLEEIKSQLDVAKKALEEAKTEKDRLEELFNKSEEILEEVKDAKTETEEAVAEINDKILPKILDEIEKKGYNAEEALSTAQKAVQEAKTYAEQVEKYAKEAQQALTNAQNASSVEDAEKYVKQAQTAAKNAQKAKEQALAKQQEAEAQAKLAEEMAAKQSDESKKAKYENSQKQINEELTSLNGENLTFKENINNYSEYIDMSDVDFDKIKQNAQNRESETQTLINGFSNYKAGSNDFYSYANNILSDGNLTAQQKADVVTYLSSYKAGRVSTKTYDNFRTNVYNVFNSLVDSNDVDKILEMATAYNSQNDYSISNFMTTYTETGNNKKQADNLKNDIVTLYKNNTDKTLKLNSVFPLSETTNSSYISNSAIEEILGEDGIDIKNAKSNYTMSSSKFNQYKIEYLSSTSASKNIKNVMNANLNNYEKTTLIKEILNNDCGGDLEKFVKEIKKAGMTYLDDIVLCATTSGRESIRNS